MEKRDKSEIAMQSRAFTNLWNNRPELRGRVFTINNNSENSIKGAIMKAMGVIPGVSDQGYVIPNSMAWIEWKTETGTQSKDQISFERLVVSMGHKYFIVRSEEQFLEVINKYA